MGILKALYYIVISKFILFMVLSYAPNLLDIEPQAYTPNLLKFEGALAVNKDLEKAEIILRGDVDGPESFVIKDGDIYASLKDGKIVLIRDDTVIKTITDICKDAKSFCRPLGIRIYKNDLYVADYGRGLLKVEINTGKVEVLLSTSDSVGGKRFNFPNDLDIDEQGMIYMSDVSTRWNGATPWYSLLEHENSGRVIRYDIHTGKAVVLVPDLFCPNGIQVSHDQMSLLISEVTNLRILRHHIQGPKKGQTEVFADLPGEPDNIRANPGGGYWVPLFSSRDVSSPNLIDRLASYPKLRKVIGKLNHLLGTVLSKITEYWPSPVLQSITEEFTSGYLLLRLWSFDHGVLVELDSEGKITRSLHSQNPQLTLFSQALEKDGYLYVGSFLYPYFAKLKL